MLTCTRLPLPHFELEGGTSYTPPRARCKPENSKKCGGALSAVKHFQSKIRNLGARLRGRTATQRSKKGSEKVPERVLGKGSQKGSEKGVCYGFYSKKGF